MQISVYFSSIIAASFLSEPDEWGTVQEGQSRPRVVKRGLDDTFLDAIEDGESEEIDHLLFVCHGIGPVCDLRFRSIYECVDGMRGIHEGQSWELHWTL